jgi:hypothetical protein
LLVARRYADATVEFRQAADAAPGDPMPLYYLAYAEHSAGWSADAEQSVRAAVSAEGGMPFDNFGREWERFQGPSRAWLSLARARGRGQ